MERHEIQKIFGTNVRNIMNKKNISNPELARRCKVSSSSVSRIVNGTASATLPMMLTIANGLEVNISLLLAGLSEETEQQNPIKEPLKDIIFAGLLSIENKRIACIKDSKGNILGTSEAQGGLDLAESTTSLIQLIKESIFEALPLKTTDPAILKSIDLKIVTQSYEFESTRIKFVNFSKKYFHHVLLLPDWQITYFSAFPESEGISLVIDKGVSLSYMHKSTLQKIGGWKYPVYDLGGENWLGSEVIHHTIEAKEGYIPMTQLARNVLAKFNGKIERITETCFKGADLDIFCLFAEPLIRLYLMNDDISTKIIKKGYEHIQRMLNLVDKNTGGKLKITLSGCLTDIYEPYLDSSRLTKFTSSKEKVELLTEITEEFLFTHGVKS